MISLAARLALAGLARLAAIAEGEEQAEETKPRPLYSGGAPGPNPCADEQHNPETLGVHPWPNGHGTRYVTVCQEQGCTWAFTFDLVRHTHRPGQEG